MSKKDAKRNPSRITIPEDPVVGIRKFEIGSDCELNTKNDHKPHKNKKRAAPTNVIQEQEEEFIDTTQK